MVLLKKIKKTLLLIIVCVILKQKGLMFMTKRNIAIGENIKSYRKKNKLTQKELADILGKTESSIRKYEKGEVTVPIDVLDDIARALHVSFYDLIKYNYPKKETTPFGTVLLSIMQEQFVGMLDMEDSVADSRGLEYSLEEYLFEDIKVKYKDAIILSRILQVSPLKLLKATEYSTNNTPIDLVNSYEAETFSSFLTAIGFDVRDNTDEIGIILGEDEDEFEFKYKLISNEKEIYLNIDEFYSLKDEIKNYILFKLSQK